MLSIGRQAGMGIWTHFIHADDVYDIPAPGAGPAYHRNADRLQWKIDNDAGQPGMFFQLDSLIGLMRADYPWVEFVATSAAEARYRAHLANVAEMAVGDGHIEIDNPAEALFYVRTDADVSLAPLKGGKIVDSRPVDGGRLHVVRCGPGRAAFRLETL